MRCNKYFPIFLLTLIFLTTLSFAATGPEGQVAARNQPKIAEQLETETKAEKSEAAPEYSHEHNGGKGRAVPPGNPTLIDKLFGGIAPKLGISGLSQFGYEIFAAPPADFAPVLTGALGPDYILGPDDNVIVNLWGTINQRYDLTIDRDGKVNILELGVVYLWGKSLGQAKDLIKEKIEKKYTNVNFDMSVGKLRSINVFVLGEVKNPGVYTLNSLSTMLHALYKAGGPTRDGSLRNIQLVRNKKTESRFDLYELLTKGDAASNERLQSDDTIFVPSIGRVAAISGNIKKPAIYELKGDSNLAELIIIAGGVSPAAYLQNIQLIRIDEFKQRVVEDLKFKDFVEVQKRANEIIIKEGDLVLVGGIAPFKHNFVTIMGNVERPGEYQLSSQMRVSNLIKLANSILPETYMERGVIERFQSDYTRVPIAFNVESALKGGADDILLKEWDIVHVYSKYEIFPLPQVSISGQVNKPGTYRYTDGMRLSDLIFFGKEVTDFASLENAELFRWNYKPGGTPEIITIDLAPVIAKKDKAKDLLLEKGDHLFIKPRAGLLEKRSITVSGEFKFPGTYALTKGATLGALIKRTGGFTDQAFLEGAVFTRESVKSIQQSMIETLINSQERALLEEEALLANSILPAEDRELRSRALEYQRKALTLMAARTPKGRVIVDLGGITNGKDDILLENNDVIEVPSIPDWVMVAGAVYNSESIAFAPGKSRDYYLDAVGGANRRAAIDDIYIIKASGRVESRSSGNSRMSRGDIIVVPERDESAGGKAKGK